jgi:hypothetical protein
MTVVPTTQRESIIIRQRSYEQETSSAIANSIAIVQISHGLQSEDASPTRKVFSMTDKVTRRVFGAGIVSGVVAAASGALAQSPPPPSVAVSPPPQDYQRDYPEPKFKPSFKKQRLNTTMVQDFVIFGHYDLDMVKKLLEREPSLLYAAMDWGGGDFETALGGASHLGRRDIATFLLEKGARPDIFTATMLGHTDVVKSLLASHPTLIDAKGPHGIPLIE